jgi:hypothetical protein
VPADTRTRKPDENRPDTSRPDGQGGAQKQSGKS